MNDSVETAFELALKAHYSESTLPARFLQV